MQQVTVIIPYLNGEAFLEECLSSLRRQTCREFEVILVDNGSSDNSVKIVKERFPEVRLHCFTVNTGFCHAVNAGIRMSDSPYVILLNNDTVCDEHFVEELLQGIKRRPRSFSCQALLRRMQGPERIDDAGDYYCALGWAFAEGRGALASRCTREKKIFAACGGAAIYNRRIIEKVGYFDEKHFAYLEDIDIGYRARIAGYENWLVPSAMVYHAGSGTSGSVYNEFKIRHTSRNSVYLIYKNMPVPQIILNSFFLAWGFFIKALFFWKKGFGKEYLTGLVKGIRMSQRENKVVFQKCNWKNYVKIQLELWYNMIRRIRSI